MRFKLDKNYSDQELKFIRENNCEILDELKLSKVHFPDSEVPLRAIKYGSTYICKVTDNETNEPVWAALTKWKGIWHFSEYYDTLESMKENL